MAGSRSGSQGGPGRQPSVRASPECIPRAQAPMAPINLIQLVSLVKLLVFPRILLVNLLISCKFITLFVIFFHAIISPDYRFFFEVPRIEEVQDPDSSPRREEVGRRTLGDYGGSLPSFFYRARFRESTSTTRKRQARKLYPNKTPITSGVEESDSPRRALLLILSDSSGGHHLKKKQWSHEIIVVRK